MITRIQNKLLPFAGYRGGGSKSSSSSNSTTNTRTINDTSEGSVVADKPSATAIKVSGSPDSDLTFEITNQGLQGEDIQQILEPAGDALEQVSQDFARTSGATAALTTTVGEIVESGQETFRKLADNLSKPEVQLGLGAMAYFWFNRKKGRKK